MGALDNRDRDLVPALERAAVIASPQHMIDHFHDRVRRCETIIDGVDTYRAQLPSSERTAIEAARRSIADIRQRASTPRRIDLRTLLREAAQCDKQSGNRCSIAASKREKVAIQATQMERRTRRHSLTKGT